MKRTLRTSCLLLFLLFLLPVAAEQLLMAQNDGEFRIARIQYRGGGDWYNDPSALTNLIRFVRERLPVPISEEYDDIQIGSRDLHEYPFATLTGHGSMVVNEAEVSNIRSWLDNGGFLYIDDDYGLDEYARELIGRIYPEDDLIELPFDHPLYNQVFPMPEGLPKIHEHDGLPPQGFAVFREGRMVIFYSYETNLMDGWAYDVHDNPEHIKEEALQMGVNLLVYALTSAR